MRAGRIAPDAAQPTGNFIRTRSRTVSVGSVPDTPRTAAADIAIPRMQNTKRPSVLARRGRFCSSSAASRGRPRAWNTFEAGWHPSRAPPYAGTASPHTLFDVEVTRRLNDLSRQPWRLAQQFPAGHSRSRKRAAAQRWPGLLDDARQYARAGGARARYRQSHVLPADPDDRRDDRAAGARAGAGQTFRQRALGRLAVRSTRPDRWYAGMSRSSTASLRLPAAVPVGSFSNLGVWNDCGMWFVCPPVHAHLPARGRRRHLRRLPVAHHRRASIDRAGCRLDQGAYEQLDH